MKRNITIIIVLLSLALSGCLTLGQQEESILIPKKYLGVYISIQTFDDVDGNVFGDVEIYSIKEITNEDGSNKNVLEIITSKTDEILTLDIKSDTDGYRMVDKDQLDFHYYVQHPYPDSYNYGNRCDINFETKSDEIYMEIKDLGQQYVQKNRWFSIGEKNIVPESAQNLREAFIQESKKEESEEAERKEQQLQSSIDYFLNKYNGKTVYIAAQSHYKIWWSEPQPFIAEYLTDDKAIRFTSENGNLMARDTVFLMTWDESFFGSFISLNSSNLSDGSELLYPNVILNGDKAFSYIENEGVSEKLNSILLSYGLKAENTEYLIDPESYDSGNLFFSMMTGGDKDVDASFYFITE